MMARQLAPCAREAGRFAMLAQQRLPGRNDQAQRSWREDLNCILTMMVNQVLNACGRHPELICWLSGKGFCQPFLCILGLRMDQSTPLRVRDIVVNAGLISNLTAGALA
jgi:hypothetical protein